MGLVNELQISAEQDDVLTVLRKTKRLSSKLGRKDILDWVGYELKGYKDSKSIPDYRIIGVSLAYNINGYIPAGYNMVQKGIMPIQDNIGLNLTRPVVEPISTIVAWIKNTSGTKKGIYQPLGKEQSDILRSLFSCTMPEILDQITFLGQMNQSDIDDIPEQVKNKVLDWACALEEAGINGDGISFSKEEKQIARTVVFNINNSNVEQLSNSGVNLSGMVE